MAAAPTYRHRRTFLCSALGLVAALAVAPGLSFAQGAAHPGQAFKEGKVEAGGFTLRYAEAGSGPVLVSLPGSAGLEMSRAKDELAKSFRVIEIEPPGWGQSDTLNRDMEQDEIGRILGEAANKLAPGGYHLLGTSMGGSNALWAATTYPDKVKSIVLEGSMAPTTPEHLKAPPIHRANIQKMLAAQAAAPPAAPPNYPNTPPDPTKPWATAEYNANQMKMRFRMMSHVEPDYGTEALYEKIRKLNTPVLSLLGDQDGLIKTSVASEYQRVMPNVKLVIIPGGGHDLQNSATDAFLAQVKPFIEQAERAR